MSTTPRTDAVQIQARTCIHHNDAERAAVTCPVCLMRENAELRAELDASCNAEELRQLRADYSELRAIIDATLSALPVGNVRTHTPDSIPERMAELVKTHADNSAENETLIDENVKANGLLDMQMKELAELRKDKARLIAELAELRKDMVRLRLTAAIDAAMEAEIPDSHEPKN